jgi:hypothetical protein
MQTRLFFCFQPFFWSLIIGVLLWITIFICLPVDVAKTFQPETFIYIIASYLCLVAGFAFFDFSKFIEKTHDNYIGNSLILKSIIAIVIISYLLRWYDLFIIRELSFYYEPKYNRILNYENSIKSNILFSLGSVLKSLYFFPFVLSFAKSNKGNKALLVFPYLLLLFPMVEAILIGTRQPFFVVFLIIFITVLVTKSFKPNFKNVSIFFVSIFLLLSLSMFILFQREVKADNTSDSFYSELLSGRYNDMVPPKDFVIDFFESPDNPELLKYYSMSLLQFGQYIIHGVFEFNYLLSREQTQLAFGKHTFYPLLKLYNQLNIFEKVELKNYTPRGYVYITFFGSMYIDFRWFGLLSFFLFGNIQKYIVQKSKSNFIYKPLMIYFLMINVFLLSFNFLRGAGIYPIFGLLVFLILFQIFQSLINEKSFNT